MKDQFILSRGGGNRIPGDPLCEGDSLSNFLLFRIRVTFYRKQFGTKSRVRSKYLKKRDVECDGTWVGSPSEVI